MAYNLTKPLWKVSKLLHRPQLVGRQYLLVHPVHLCSAENRLETGF